MARSKVWDGTNWVYQNTVVHSGGGSGSSTSIITSWDDLPQNPSIGDRATNINDNASSGTNYLLPQIIITAPIGTQITVTNNITTYTTTAISTTSKVNVNDYGTWTVTMVSGDETRTRTVSVDTVKQYSSLWSRLPNGYQEVEYIESTGTQCINTGYVPDKYIKFEYDIQTTELTSTEQWVSGIDWGSHTECWYSLGTFMQNALGFYATTSGGIILNTPDTQRHSYVYNDVSNIVYIDGVIVGVLSNMSNCSCGSNTLGLFARYNSGGNYNYFWRGKLYSFKAYRNGILELNLVPCYRTSDEVIGLYNTVTNQFHIDVGGGTDPFIKGGNV